MNATDYPLLTALLAPMLPHEFLDRHWPGQPVEVHGAPERLPRLLRDPALASAVAFAQRYTGRLRFTHGGSQRMQQSSDAKAETLLDMGLTVQFVDVDAVLPGAVAFHRQLETELGVHEGAVSTSVFVAARDDGLSCHFDRAELISVQLVGTKRFHYAPAREIPSPCFGQYAVHSAPFDDLYPQAVAGFPEPPVGTTAVADMRPGSVLFLPRGYWHFTTAGEDSLSVSIAIDTPPALRSLLEQLKCLLLQDPRWRQPLGGAGGRQRDDARRRAAELLATLPAAIARVSPDDLTSAPAGLDWRLAHLGPATRFQRTPHARVEIGAPVQSGRLPMHFVLGHKPMLARSSAPLEISAATAPVMRWMDAQTHGPFAAAALAAAFPAIPFATLADVLRVCVQAQYLRLLWFPALAREP